MTRSIVWTISAEADLERLWDFSADQVSLSFADQVIDRLYATPEYLAEMPELGERIDKFCDNCRKLVSPPYELIYRYNDSTIEVIRVFHTREFR